MARSGIDAVEFEGWRVLGNGVEFAEFQLPLSPLGVGDGVVKLIRIDPLAVELVLLCANQQGHDSLSADEWAKRYGLSVVVNAGMFEGNLAMSHTGYLRNENGVQSPHIRDDYLSVFGFGAIGGEVRRASIFDVDDLGRMETIIAQYPVVVQNLRLVKRPGENRWTKQEKRWSECAIGQDGDGRLLLIFCRTPYSMYELNEHLLRLPIDLRCAQHLEGGPEASLLVELGETSIREAGSYETNFNENDDHLGFMLLPNVIGIRSGANR